MSSTGKSCIFKRSRTLCAAHVFEVVNRRNEERWLRMMWSLEIRRNHRNLYDSNTFCMRDSIHIEGKTTERCFSNYRMQGARWKTAKLWFWRITVIGGACCGWLHKCAQYFWYNARDVTATASGKSSNVNLNVTRSSPCRIDVSG